MKKRERPTPGKQTAELGPGSRRLPNGDVLYRIVTDYSEVTCQFSPEKIKTLLRAMIVDLFEKSHPRGPDFVVPGESVRTVVEAKLRNVSVPTRSAYGEKEISEEIDFYAEEAYKTFTADIEEALRRGLPTYVVEVLTATVGSLEKDGALLTRLGVAAFYDEIFKALLGRFKVRWDAPGSGRRTLAGDRKRAKLIPYFETLYLIARARRNAKGKKVDKELQKEAREAEAGVEPVVLSRVDDLISKGTSSADIAWELAREKYLPKSKASSRAHLTEARKDRGSKEG